mmetsp:Transcript_24938/g.50611  ORF Transcript_24938/g.50611 Transcript_24938/m.50611 type:complete len:250 (-) Transcript_24938:252-1001(-)
MRLCQAQPSAIDVKDDVPVKHPCGPEDRLLDGAVVLKSVTPNVARSVFSVEVGLRTPEHPAAAAECDPQCGEAREGNCRPLRPHQPAGAALRAAPAIAVLPAEAADLPVQLPVEGAGQVGVGRAGVHDGVAEAAGEHHAAALDGHLRKVHAVVGAHGHRDPEDLLRRMKRGVVAPDRQKAALLSQAHGEQRLVDVLLVSEEVLQDGGLAALPWCHAEDPIGLLRVEELCLPVVATEPALHRRVPLELVA